MSKTKDLLIEELNKEKECIYCKDCKYKYTGKKLNKRFEKVYGEYFDDRCNPYFDNKENNCKYFESNINWFWGLFK